MLSIILQICVCITGPAAIWLAGRTDRRINKWGYVVGLVSQVFWAGLFIVDHQYVMLLVDAIYTWVWYVGFRNHWRKCARCGKRKPKNGKGHLCVDCIDVLFGRHND